MWNVFQFMCIGCIPISIQINLEKALIPFVLNINYSEEFYQNKTLKLNTLSRVLLIISQIDCQANFLLLLQYIAFAICMHYHAFSFHKRKICLREDCIF